MTTTEFTQFQEDETQAPNMMWAAYHHSDKEPQWSDTVRACLRAWRIEAPVYFEPALTADTGFDHERARQRLNALGKLQLPDTPTDSSDVARNTVVTQVTEILALKYLLHKGVKVPTPRVYFHEDVEKQHLGIDLLGYIVSESGPILVVAEVKASAQERHPPSVNYDLMKQLVEDTLDQDPPTRLSSELRFVHAMTDDDEDKNVLNELLTRLHEGRLRMDNVVAAAILVRSEGLWNTDDWKPFSENVSVLSSTKIPAMLWAIGIECDLPFVELINRIKDSVS